MIKKISFFLLLMVFISNSLFSQEKWVNFTKEKEIWALAVEDNFLWIGTDVGAYKWNFITGEYIKYTTADGLAGNKINSILVDSNGNKWFGTNNGLSKFDGINWIIYITADGLPSNSVSSIAIDLENNKWFGTYKDGVCKFDGINWTTYTDADGLSENNVQTIAIDSWGNKWFGIFAVKSGGVSFLGDPATINLVSVDKLIEKKVASDAEIISVAFEDHTSITLEFNSGDISGKTIKVRAYGNNTPPEIPVENTLHYTTGYYDINSDDIEAFQGTLYLRYTDSALSASNIDEDSLVIAYYNPIDSKWHSFSTLIDRENNIAAAEINHFSIWALTDKDEPLITEITKVKEEKKIETYILAQNYPNPFNLETNIKYQIPKLSFVTIKIYSVLGQEIRTLVEKQQTSGAYQVRWDGKNNMGQIVSGGIYFYRLKADNFIQTKKLILLK